MGEHEEQIVFEMGYNKGFKDGIKCSIPKDQYEEQIKINNKLVKDNKQLGAYITMMQVDYNLRLKAEKVAMLTELQAEIEECKEDTENYSDYNAGLRQGIYAIQQKIDKFKGNKQL